MKEWNDGMTKWILDAKARRTIARVALEHMPTGYAWTASDVLSSYDGVASAISDANWQCRSEVDLQEPLLIYPRQKVTT